MGIGVAKINFCRCWRHESPGKGKDFRVVDMQVYSRLNSSDRMMEKNMETTLRHGVQGFGLLPPLHSVMATVHNEMTGAQKLTLRGS